jgi:hypothetical protein
VLDEWLLIAFGKEMCDENSMTTDDRRIANRRHD